MGIRLIFGIFLTYPIFWIFRGSTISTSSIPIQHSFFISSGLFLGWWAFGMEALFHGSLSILGTYFLIKILGPTYEATLCCFIYCFGYLVVGYYFTETDSYDISWTMPHCVLTLRLIAIAFDAWDGTKPQKELGNDQLKTRLDYPPSLLEIFSAVFFPGGYFIGPQFSLARYRSFVKRNTNGEIPKTPYDRVLKCIILGMGYLLFHAIGSTYMPLDWLTSSIYIEQSFGPTKVISAFLWVKIMMSKYIGSWLLSEGSMIFSGLAYDPDIKKDPWSGGCNVRVKQWEFSGNLKNMVDSFNINTNIWAAAYVYKRLKFINNRTVSTGATLFFLALWHGLHSGYYATFFLEFLMLNFERSTEDIRERVSPHLGSIGSNIIGILYIVLVLPHCFLPFGLLVWDKYWLVIQSSYGMPYGFFLLWPFVSNRVKQIFFKMNLNKLD